MFLLEIVYWASLLYFIVEAWEGTLCAEREVHWKWGARPSLSMEVAFGCIFVTFHGPFSGSGNFLELDVGIPSVLLAFSIRHNSSSRNAMAFANSRSLCTIEVYFFFYLFFSLCNVTRRLYFLFEGPSHSLEKLPLFCSPSRQICYSSKQLVNWGWWSKGCFCNNTNQRGHICELLNLQVLRIREQLHELVPFRWL